MPKRSQSPRKAIQFMGSLLLLPSNQSDLFGYERLSHFVTNVFWLRHVLTPEWRISNRR
jgi:hypothetical protein